MSRRDRRDPNDVDVVYHVIQVVCFRDGDHHIGKVVRQRGRNTLSEGFSRIDGPNGETKDLASCPKCRGGTQLRWGRLQAILDEMEAAGEHERTIAPS